MLSKIITHIKGKLIELFIHAIMLLIRLSMGVGRGMEEKNVLISSLTLMELNELAKTYLKLTKNDNETIKKKAEKSLIKILDLMDRARNREIMTSQKFMQEVWKEIPR